MREITDIKVFAKLDIRLSNKDRRQTADLKVKVDTGAQGNIAAAILQADVSGEINGRGNPSHDQSIN